MHRLVLLPGLACDATLFQDQLAALAEHHWVRVSTVHTREPSLPAMAERLLAELPDDAPLVFIGSSMGAMLAMHIAHLAPQRVKALALLSTSARADTPELIELRSSAIVQFEAGGAERVLRDNAIFAFHPENGRDPTAVSGYVQAILRAGVPQLVAQNRAVMAREDMRAWLPALRCPVLVACGDRDLVTPLAMSEEIAGLIPGAQLAVVERAGHLMTWEQPEAVNRLLLDWLAAL